MSVAARKPPPVLPPGTYLEEWIEDNDLDRAGVARRLNCSLKHLSQVINGHVTISPAFAAKLELVTQISSEFWLVHQARYDARTAAVAVSAKDIASIRTLIPPHCLAFWRGQGLISNTWHRGEELVRELYRRFRVSSVKALEREMNILPLVAYRQSEAFDIQTVPLRFWLLAAEMKADDCAAELPPYSEGKLREKVKALRALTTVEPEDFVTSALDHLRECGVGLSALPDLRGARVSGATFLKNGNPIIIVTDRHHREDIFWFTLFHEIAHILHGDLETVTVDLDLDDAQEANQSEKQADEFAAETLLPQEFDAVLLSVGSKQHAQESAGAFGISVGILVGRLHHLGIKEPSWGRDLIRRFDAEI